MAQYTKQDLQILEEPFVEIRKKVTILLRMGCLLSENGANANQIVRDMRRAAAYMGIPKDYLHIHIAYSNILINIHGESECITSFRKVQYMGANMEVISAISVLTWTALLKVYTLDEFSQKLEEIAKKILPIPMQPLLCLQALHVVPSPFYLVAPSSLLGLQHFALSLALLSY